MRCAHLQLLAPNPLPLPLEACASVSDAESMCAPALPAHFRAGTRPTSAPGLGPHLRRDSARIRAGTRPTSAPGLGPALPRRPLTAGRRAGVYATMNGSRKNYQCHQPRRAASTFETAAVQGCPRSGLPPLGVAPARGCPYRLLLCAPQLLKGLHDRRQRCTSARRGRSPASPAGAKPHLRQDLAHSCHICAGTGLAPKPHLHRDWARPLPTSALRLGSPLPTSATGLGSPLPTSAPGLRSPLPTSAPGLRSPAKRCACVRVCVCV